ncbi:TolC family protein [Thiomicrorhabdus xiamenensis]|uniref:TolC family protein n=1 Tax=Thiomicrorhabdus xiamenensis TaxID=2739063 RepID=A0A7D4NRK8_9GAMM|nr:TolC family protein [Thiomicrorhabdus xiamenensis]QKI90111.1 TolC family protein [Thiomicrorhabdus xiamenensis]
MYVWKRYFSIFLSGALLSAPVLADSTVSGDYAGLIDKVLQQQPQTLKQQDWQELAETYRKQSERWISEDVELTLHYENDALMSNDDLRNYEVGASAALQLPGRQKPLNEVASAYQMLPEIQQSYLRWQASAKVRELSWQLKRAQVQFSTAKEALAQSRELQQKVELKYQAGDATQLERLLAQSETVKQEAELEAVSHQLQLAQQQFTLWTQGASLPQNLEEKLLTKLDESAHPQLQWLQAQQNLAQSQLSVAQSRKTAPPSFYLGAKHDSNPGTDHSTLIAEFSVPLGLDQQRRVSIAMEREKLTDQKVNLAQAKLDLQQKMVSGEQRLSDLQKQQSLWQKNLQLNREKLQMMQKAYQLGAVSIESLLRVQQEFLMAQRQLAMTEVELGFATAELNQIYGHSLSSN